MARPGIFGWFYQRACPANVKEKASTATCRVGGLTWHTNYAAGHAKAKAEEIKGLIIAEMFGSETKQWLDAPAGSSQAVAAAAGMAQGGSPFGVAMKSLGEAFTESTEFKEFREMGGFTMRTPFELDAYDVASNGWGQKDVYTGLATHNVGMGIGTRVQFDPTVPRGQRTYRVRDLFPAATTSARTSGSLICPRAAFIGSPWDAGLFSSMPALRLLLDSRRRLTWGASASR